MRAIVYDRFGGPDVLRAEQVTEPHPGPGQVRLRVRAAGVNPLDYKIRNGWLEAVFPVRFPVTPGLEAAGVVDEVGEGVTDLAVGDEVLALTDTGAYAEYALASVAARKPAGLGWDEAAALPTAGETAQRVLDLLAVGAGDTLLVHAAAGGVGGLAVQLARLRGAIVVGTASPPTTPTCANSAPSRWRTARGWWTVSARPPPGVWTPSWTPRGRTPCRPRSPCGAGRRTGSSRSPTRRRPRWA